MNTNVIEDQPLAERAAEAVTTVAERLADPGQVAAVSRSDDNRDPIYNTLMWTPVTLSTGLPGVATMYAELARFDRRWLGIAHRHIEAAGHAMPAHPSRGLYAGPAAVLAAAQVCGGQYPGLRKSLATWVAEDQLARLAVVGERPGIGVSWDGYDLINGLSGPARLLTDCVQDPAETAPIVERALMETLTHLVAVCAPISVANRQVPGWYVPPELQITDRDRADYPRGDFNLGLAHGIAGPLMVLSLAVRRGIEVPGIREAIGEICRWLISWIQYDEHGRYWPCRVSLDDELAADRPGNLFTRTAWCYGAPGIAAAMHHAGVSLNEPKWRATAAGVLREALRRPESQWTLNGPTVCHGYAGLLQVVHRVGTAEADEELLAARGRLVSRVLDYFDPETPFGFRHFMKFAAARPGPTPYKELDVAGLLEGAAGVACALLSIIPRTMLSAATDVTPTEAEHRAWDRVIALS